MLFNSLSALIGTTKERELTTTLMRSIVDFYGPATVQFRLQQIQSIIPLSRYVVTARMKRANSLLKEYVRAGIEPFVPVIWNDAGKFRLIFPPVVECNPKPVLMDGTHRSLAALRLGIDTIIVVSVSPTRPHPLPCEPTRWEDIQEAQEQRPVEEILRCFKPHLFRPVTDFFNSPALMFDAVEDIYGFCEAIMASAPNSPAQNEVG